MNDMNPIVFWPANLVEIVPPIKAGTRDAEFLQCSAHRQMRLLDQSDDLQFLGSRISHSSLPPSAIMLFLSNRNSSACSATTYFNARASRRRSLTSPLVAARAVTPDNRRLCTNSTAPGRRSFAHSSFA